MKRSSHRTYVVLTLLELQHFSSVSLRNQYDIHAAFVIGGAQFLLLLYKSSPEKHEESIHCAHLA